MNQRLRLRFGWFAANAVVPGIAVVSIVSVVAPDVLPVAVSVPRFAGESTVGVLVFGWIGVWLVGLGWFDRWRWRRVGAAAGFTPENGSLLSGRDLVGEVDGREVRAIMGNGHQTVLTELAAEPTAGAVLGHLEETYSKYEFADYADHADGDLAAVASDPDLAEALLTGRSGEALASSDDVLFVVAGDAPNAFHDWDPDSKMVTYEDGEQRKIRQDSETYDVFADRTDEMHTGGLIHDVPTTGDRQTVACVNFHPRPHGRIWSGRELQQQAAVVAAVVDAFERSSATDVDPGGR